jgi:hypothetical protein
VPFQYYGGKKGLARYYPPPAFGTIVEPFAGSAGYALHWATPRHRVVLIEKDPAVVALWRRLQAPNARDDILAIRLEERTAEPLVALTAGGEAVGGRWKPSDRERSDDMLVALTGRHVGRPVSSEPLALLTQGRAGGSLKATRASSSATSFAITDRMRRDWPKERARLIAALPLIRGWEIIEGDYHDAPDVRGAWFVDPPYWVPENGRGTRGDGYRFGASLIDYDELAAWCKRRRGQVIVCEQAGAEWLPFRPLRRWNTANGDAGSRVEVVWTRTPNSVVATPRARHAKLSAKERKVARRGRL